MYWERTWTIWVIEIFTKKTVSSYQIRIRTIYLAKYEIRSRIGSINGEWSKIESDDVNKSTPAVVHSTLQNARFCNLYFSSSKSFCLRSVCRTFDCFSFFFKWRCNWKTKNIQKKMQKETIKLFPFNKHALGDTKVKSGCEIVRHKSHLYIFHILM